MNRRSFLKTALAAPLALQAQSRKPNIIVIVSDDHGWNEIGVQGGEIPTPNIDSIAKNGVRFSNGYVSCPVCSPTRAGLMTGRYQQRFGHEFNPGPAAAADQEFGLPLTETTLAAALKKAGYKTGMVGKWHLGYQPPYHPMKRGFDEFFGFAGGAHSYVDARADSANPILRGTEPVDEKLYLTQAFTREAVAFIDKRKAENFFLYLTFNAVHAPLQGLDDYLKRFENISDTKRRTFAAMLSALDDGVGRVLEAVRRNKLENDTLIFFIADNGGPTPQTSSRNNPLRGFKGQTFEGGIRVPFLAQWAGKIPAGKVYEKPVISLDIFPTAAAAAGIKSIDKLDGVDLLPFVTGTKSSDPHDALYWRFGEQWAIRKGDWKLVSAATAPALHNLASDIGEQTDLSAKEPGKAKELRDAYDAWAQTLAKPLWTRPARGGKGKRKRRA